MVQRAGHLIINNEKLLVLCRMSGWKRFFKLRKTGVDGLLQVEESSYIEGLVNNGSDILDDLKAGNSIQIE